MTNANDWSNLKKEDAYIKRDIENTFVFLMHGPAWHHLTFNKFNNFGTWRFNSPKNFFIYSAAIPSVYLSPGMYMKPALIKLNMVYK